MFTKTLYMNAYSSYIHNSLKLETTQVSFMGDWFNYGTSILAIEYYSATKRNKLLIYAKTSMSLQRIMLSEKKQQQKKQISNGYRTIWYHLYKILEIAKLLNGEHTSSCQRLGRKWGQEGRYKENLIYLKL